MKTLETLSLPELFRYFFCGGAFVCVFRYSRGTHGLPPADSAAVLFVIALLAGSVIYAVHRSLIYPAFGRAALWLALGRPKRKGARYYNPFKPLLGEISRDQARWKRRQDEKSVQCHLDEWAAQVHLLYCVAWATLLATTIATLWFPLPSTGVSRFSWLLTFAVSISLVAAFVADYRRRLVEEQLPKSL